VPVAGSSVAGAGKKLKGTCLGLLGVHGGQKEKDNDTASVHSTSTARRGPIHGT
jgi:hypothetical protein